MEDSIVDTNIDFLLCIGSIVYRLGLNVNVAEIKSVIRRRLLNLIRFYKLFLIV